MHIFPPSLYHNALFEGTPVFLSSITIARKNLLRKMHFTEKRVINELTRIVKSYPQGVDITS